MRSGREQWVERVEQWRRSGLSAKRFAQSIGVNAGTLTHWAWQLGSERRKQRRPGVSTPAGGAPLVEIIGGTTRDAHFELIVANGWRLRISASFDAAALQRLLAVLEARR